MGFSFLISKQIKNYVGISLDNYAQLLEVKIIGGVGSSIGYLKF
jgi:hypothetical protein